MKLILVAVALVGSLIACAQSKVPVITEKEVARIESTLASDEMRGRRAGTPDINKVAAFIAEEFKKAGLQPLQGNSFLQEFSMLQPKLKSITCNVDGKEVDEKKIFVFTSSPLLEVNEDSGYTLEQVKTGDNLFRKAMQFIQAKKNIIALVDSSFAPRFSRLNGFTQQQFKLPYSVIFILDNRLPKQFSIKAEHSFSETKFYNVVGLLPGRKEQNEYVIFSGHYDHLGVGKPVNGDSIYNGANDDAAGITAVITLADYFKAQHNNERTLVFAAFTAEELGGFGSQYFSQQLNPDSVVAMFNIEMIGTESKWGRNSAYITGFDKTNMGAILQRNLQGSSFTFYPDPYPEQQLFYRSDNATLARQGVPAHTISTSKMDHEPNYHQLSDEVRTLDLKNMTQIIKAIATSARTIVQGIDTPDRVKPETLN